MTCPQLFGFLWRPHRWQTVHVRPRLAVHGGGIIVEQECVRCGEHRVSADWGGVGWPT